MNRGLPRTWLLLGKRTGDNNQVLALGEALGLPFEALTLLCRTTAIPRMRLFPTSIGHLTRASQRRLQPPWPDLVIGIGRRTVPVARWIREQSGGRSKLVRIGHPRAASGLFDLVITTRQYPVPPGENVVTLPLAMSRFARPPQPTAEEQARLDALPRPHLLLSLGGPAVMWRLDSRSLGDASEKLAKRAEACRGTLLVIGSSRTPADAWATIRKATSGSRSISMIGPELRYGVLLADADEHFVTADSMSMISEAVLTGKPVGLIPVERDVIGKLLLPRDPNRTKLRDSRRFWLDVEARGLVGTVDQPKRGAVENPVETAVTALRDRLGGLFE
jgi:mitochondrial fission protein ELM1